MKPTEPRHRLDDLRKLATDLLSRSGVSPARASALASLILWHDAAGVSPHGMIVLPDILGRIARKEIDPKAEGKVGPERAATAVVDGKNGPPLLTLARAGEIASEKARDVGVGLVRVKGIGVAGSAMAIVAEMAVGPVMAMALGPDGAWSAAFPSAEGIPLVGDSTIGEGRPATNALGLGSLAIEPGEWAIQAVTIAAFEPLAVLHRRVTQSESGPAWLPASTWGLARHESRDRGIALPTELVSDLKTWADRLGVATV